MARNAKLDLAKRQAVGIFRKASLQASINKGEAVYSGGDYRAPEASKFAYQGKPDAEMLALVRACHHVKVKVCKPATNSSGRFVQLDTNRPRSGCDPRTRGELLPGKAERIAPGILTPPRG